MLDTRAADSGRHRAAPSLGCLDGLLCRGGAHGLVRDQRRRRPRRRRVRRGPPPLLDPARERDTRRILRLFAPYRARLSVVLGLIVLSSVLNGISPFLLRAIIGVAFVSTT